MHEALLPLFYALMTILNNRNEHEIKAIHFVFLFRRCGSFFNPQRDLNSLHELSLELELSHSVSAGYITLDAHHFL